jgi:hypothetical protein
MVRIGKKELSLISISLSVIGILIWLFLILTTRIWWVDPGNELGLFQVIPFYFWIALFLQIAGIFTGIKINNGYLFFFQIIFINLMVWGTPALIEPNARIMDSWQWLGTSKTIMDSGNIIVNNSNTHFYLQWPGSFIFNAVSMKITSINPLLYLQYYPLFTSTVFIFFYYLWIRTLTDNVCIRRYSIILFIFLNLWLQFHLSPQAFGLMLLPLILIVIRKKGFAWRLVLAILVIALIVSHPTTVLFLFMIIICLELIKLFTGFRNKDEVRSNQVKKISVISIMIIAFCSIIIVGVILLTPGNISKLIDVDRSYRIVNSIFSSRIQNPSSIIRACIFMGASVLVLITLFINKNHNNKCFKFSMGWFVGCCIPILWDITVAEGHFHDRSLMFAYMLMPLLLVQFFWFYKSMDKFKHIAVSLFIVISLFGTYTLYSNENSAIVPDSNLAAARHIIEYQNDTTIYSSKMVTVYAYDSEAEHLNFIGYTGTGREIEENSTVIFDKYTTSEHTSNAKYFSESLERYESEKHNRIYDNNKFVIFITGE